MTTHDPGLHERSRLEGHAVGQRVQDPRRDDDEFAPAAAAGEADRVVALAQVRVAGAAAGAAHAADVPFAHDALARIEAGHAVSDRIDDSAPLVARNDREVNPARVEGAGHDVEIRAADPGEHAANTDLTGSGRRRLDVLQDDDVRLLDDDRSHGDKWPRASEPIAVRMTSVRLEHALAMVRFVVEKATSPVSVFVSDDHGEVVAAATMDGAAPDTRLNAQRKAYTAARSDATSTAELAVKAREDAAERASFDPFFTFFQGGVAAFEDGRRVGAVGVSGLPGPDDDALARQAIAAAGLSTVD